VISENQIGDKNYWFGKHRSEKTKRKQSESMKEKIPSPKKISTPLKSISEKTALSFLNAMTTTYKPPDMTEKKQPQQESKTPLKSINESIAHSFKKEMTSGKNVPGYKPSDMKEKTPSQKQTSTPLKSILGKLTSSAENAMLTTYKTPLKSINELIAHSFKKEMTSGKNVPGYKAKAPKK